MTDLNCGECGGMGWTDESPDGCPVCNPPREKPKRRKAQRGLRRQSPKKKQEIAETKDLRAMWLQAIKVCEVCKKKRATDVHEIPAGKGRHLAVRHPRTWIAVCRECHDLIQGGNLKMQVEVATKATRDAVNTCIGRNAV